MHEIRSQPQSDASLGGVLLCSTFGCEKELASLPVHLKLL